MLAQFGGGCVSLGQVVSLAYQLGAHQLGAAQLGPEAPAAGRDGEGNEAAG